MNRQQKQELITNLKDDFSQSGAAFFVNYQGLSVAELQNLRRRLRDLKGVFKVAKARLIKRALLDEPALKGLGDYCKGQVGVVFASRADTAVPKALQDFVRDHQKLEIIVGFMESRVLDKDSVLRVASLPSKEGMLASVAGVLQAPIAHFARLLEALRAQKESAGEQK
jgi:large subunit ribosomal protein L10